VKLLAREAGVSKAREASDSIKPGAQAPGRIDNKDKRAREAGVSKAREASDSIKPGAQAPGSNYEITREPVKRATATARFAGLIHFFDGIPGACAPGFMLTPASQVKTFKLYTCFAG
jgi:hypothetical protein